MNARTLIAVCLATLATAGSVHASEADSVPMPSWNPTQSVFGVPAPTPHAQAMTAVDARMSATGSGTGYCTTRDALNPNAGRNASAHLC